MSAIRSSRTGPEMAFHGGLKGRKVRHRMWPKMHGSPDALVFPRTVVFINGCFWHGCPDHFRCPRTNRKFWAEKVSRNLARQIEVMKKLRADGWIPTIVWEHELKKLTIKKALDGFVVK